MYTPRVLPPSNAYVRCIVLMADMALPPQGGLTGDSGLSCDGATILAQPEYADIRGGSCRRSKCAVGRGWSDLAANAQQGGAPPCSNLQRPICGSSRRWRAPCSGGALCVASRTHVWASYGCQGGHCRVCSCCFCVRASHSPVLLLLVLPMSKSLHVLFCMAAVFDA